MTERSRYLAELPYPANLSEEEWERLVALTPPNAPAFAVRHGYGGVRLWRQVQRQQARDTKRGEVAFRKVWEPKFYWEVVK